MAELKDLLVNRAELDRQLLAELLAPYIGIDAERREVVPMARWGDLSPEGKTLVFLLARKAMCALPEVDLNVEAAPPKEIEAGTGVKGGTLRPKLGKMMAQGILRQDAAKGYFIPTHAVHRAKQIIEEEKKNE